MTLYDQVHVTSAQDPEGVIGDVIFLSSAGHSMLVLLEDEDKLFHFGDESLGGILPISIDDDGTYYIGRVRIEIKVLGSANTN